MPKGKSVEAKSNGSTRELKSNLWAVEPLFQKVYSNLHESRTLVALRAALQPKVLSGELCVPAAKLTEAIA